MRKLRNTLYITSPEAYLSRDGDNIVVKIGNKEVARRPVHILENIVCFNYTGMNGALLRLCAEHNVGVSLMDARGRFCGRFQGEVNGNVLLRRRQYRVADAADGALAIAKNIILGKIANSRKTLGRSLRDHSDKVNTQEVEEAIALLTDSIERVKEAPNADLLRGLEGQAAKIYFSVLNNLILQQREDFSFDKRSKRPPLDPFNAMLSYVYTLLTIDCQNALETVGLDPYVGFFHTDRPGRAGLALDIMEEFRSYLGDRFVLSLINRRQITAADFQQKESGAVLLEDDGKKTLLGAWQKRKQDVIEHPFLKEKVEAGLLPYVQAMLLSSFLRGDIEEYPPFFVR
ncbi:MAG: type I-C CRISPR-associated endonuclease Cas1c [Bacillota bacterium]|nr:type I-C CRISPR-associated endonuclease Cas1c [Bacillota bacterium]